MPFIFFIKLITIIYTHNYLKVCLHGYLKVRVHIIHNINNLFQLPKLRYCGYMSEDEKKLIISKVRSFNNGQRVITVPSEDTTLKDNDPVRIIKLIKGDVI